MITKNSTKQLVFIIQGKHLSVLCDTLVFIYFCPKHLVEFKLVRWNKLPLSSGCFSLGVVAESWTSNIPYHACNLNSTPTYINTYYL